MREGVEVYEVTIVTIVMGCFDQTSAVQVRRLHKSTAHVSNRHRSTTHCSLKPQFPSLQ